MIKIKFLNGRKFQEAEFKRIAGNIVQLIGGFSKNTSGFKTYKANEIEIGDFSDYTTIYRTVDGGFQLSNDGSVYPDPSPDEPITFEDLLDQFNAMKAEQEEMVVYQADLLYELSLLELGML